MLGMKCDFSQQLENTKKIKGNSLLVTFGSVYSSEMLSLKDGVVRCAVVHLVGARVEREFSQLRRNERAAADQPPAPLIAAHKHTSGPTHSNALALSLTLLKI